VKKRGPFSQVVRRRFRKIIMCLSHLRWDKILTKSASRLVPRLRRGARFASYQVKKRGPFSQVDLGKSSYVCPITAVGNFLRKSASRLVHQNQKRGPFFQVVRRRFGKSSCVYLCENVRRTFSTIGEYHGNIGVKLLDGPPFNKGLFEGLFS